MRVKGKDLRVGDVIEIWWKPYREQIVELIPYTEPFDFTCYIAKFAIRLGMTIATEEYYEVFNRQE